MKNIINNKGFSIPVWAQWIVAVMMFIAFAAFCRAAHYPMIISVLTFFVGFHFVFFKKGNLKKCLYSALLLALLIVTADVMIRAYDVSPFLVPVASVVMLTVFLFNDLHLAFIMAFLSSAIVMMIAGADYRLMMVYFLGGMSGAYAIWDARTRGQFIKAGLVMAIVQVICVVIEYPYLEQMYSRDFWLTGVVPLILNAMLSFAITMAMLRIFEQLFGVVTNYTLLELSDFNHPLLKRMMIEAPGTYQHSLSVSQLAEAAADSIGANGLLCRVGGYYHDIGKLVTPEYFTENQNAGLNKHDDIEPTMSRLVILNHVKEGMELGKKYRLNPVILSFIPEHHGTSLIHYFYHKSMEDAQEGEEIKEEDFRYPGPKPQSRETAILMMADSVEGAVRAMDDHAPSRIEDVVQKVINNKFIDGQLDECSLTLKDINKISQTFVRMLSAMYHSRVRYPDRD